MPAESAAPRQRKKPRRRFEAFFKSLGMPQHLTEFRGVKKEDLTDEVFHEMAKRIPYYRDNGTRIGVIKPLDENDIVEIYRRAI